MIKDRKENLIVVLLILAFIVACFFSIRFLKTKITEATTSGQNETTGSLNMDDWNKIKHHFGQ